MKKIIIWGLLIIAVMMAAKNPQVLDMADGTPKELWLWVKKHFAGVADYKQEEFLGNIAQERLTLSKREHRYIRNISEDSSSLLMFYNRYCNDSEAVNQVLDDDVVSTVCRVTQETMLLE